MTLNIKTDFDRKQEQNDRIVAAAYYEAQAKYRGTSPTRLMRALAETGKLPYTSLAGIRSSLIRSNVYTARND